MSQSPIIRTDETPMPETSTAGSPFRFERKFLITEYSYGEVEALVKLHPASFREIHMQRYVNNIYLESHGWDCYFDSVEGHGKRTKIRVRWYGDLTGSIAKPVLEFKSKSGLVGRKRSFALQPFTLTKGFDQRNFDEVIDGSALPNDVLFDLRQLRPVLLNRYSRKYYQSADKRYRITLDTDVSFFHFLGSFRGHAVTSIVPGTMILELKYSMADDDTVPMITSLFPWRVSKSSKYVTGVEQLYEL